MICVRLRHFTAPDALYPVRLEIRGRTATMPYDCVGYDFSGLEEAWAVLCWIMKQDRYWAPRVVASWVG